MTIGLDTSEEMSYVCISGSTHWYVHGAARGRGGRGGGGGGGRGVGGGGGGGGRGGVGDGIGDVV